ncbi:MAG: S8 family serine peptidase [Bacteroidota bacterium]
MNIRTLFLALLLLALLFLFYFLGCLGGTSCEETIEDLPYSDSYCEVEYLDFAGLDQGEKDPLTLAGGEAADGRQVRYARIVLPPNSARVFLNYYRNFPGSTTLEYYDYQCGGEASLINTQQLDGLVETREQSLPMGLSQVVVRMIITPAEGYTHQAQDEISLATFQQAPSQEVDENGIPLACGGGAYQRLVVTSNNPTRDLVTELSAEGLTVAALCDCNPNLVVVDVPPGIDLEALKPKLRESNNSTQASTDSLFMDQDAVIEPAPLLPDLADNFIPNVTNQGPIINDLPAFFPDFEIIWPTGQDVSCLLWEPPYFSNLPEDAVRMAIVDSGVDTSFFYGLSSATALSSDSDDCYPSGRHGYDHIRSDDSPNDEENHGTMVASSLTAKLTSEHPVRMTHYKFYANGGGSYFDALCAMHTAMVQDARVINTSWGFYAEEMPETLEETLRRADSLDVIVVAAAGNDSLNLDSLHFYPAAATVGFPLLLSVGSYEYVDTDGDVSRSAFSNYSPSRVDLLAYHTMAALTFNDFNYFVAFPRGTSISAPLVSKELIEIFAVNPGLKAADALSQLYSSNTELSSGLEDQVANGRYLRLDCE